MLNITICVFCKHFKNDNLYEMTCKAFPNGIPKSVLYRGNNHDKPFKSQKNDIVFEPENKAEFEKVKMFFRK